MESVTFRGETVHVAHCPHGPSVQVPSADDVPDELAEQVRAWIQNGATIQTATSANPAAALASTFETAPPAIRKARWGVSSERAPAGVGEASPDAAFRRAGAEPPAIEGAEYAATAAVPNAGESRPARGRTRRSSNPKNRRRR